MRLLVMTLAPTLSAAQTTPPAAFTAKFVPQQSVRYEFEGIVHISSDHAANVKLTGPRDCSYRLQAVLKFDFGPASADGALAGRVHFQGMHSSAPDCADAGKAGFASALGDLETNGTEFQIHAAGDVRLKRPTNPSEPEIVSVLMKAAWDVLQPRLSDGALAPGSAWVASRRFLYWPDTFVEGMEVAATSVQYAHDVTVAGHACALLKYKQVFSPADMPAYVDARSRARDFTGTTFVTGRGGVSLLLDRSSQRIVYARRERSIDNRMMLQYEDSQTSVALANFAVEEESTVRWLPEENSESFLADLHRFETYPGGAPVAPEGRGEPSSLATLAAASRRKEKAEPRELAELLDRPPHGFERWRKNYCSGAYCFELSIAVPEGTRAADTTGMTVLLLSGSGERTVMIAIGPMLDHQTSGLHDDELLQQQTSRFITNNLWFARGTGEPLNFSSENLDNRPAGFSDFTATARDLAPIRGRLALVIGPYGRLVPVACSYSAAQQETLDTVCQTVSGSVVIH